MDTPDLLRQFCLEHFKTPPFFSYNNYGQTNLFISTITLPKGEKISSIPCNTKMEAASNASEKALAFLKSAIQPFGGNQNYGNNMEAHVLNMMKRPQPPNFQPEYRPLVYCPPFMPPPSFQHPPPPQFPPFFNAPHFDAPVMRHLQPHHSAPIPDSYVKANQMMLLDPESVFDQKQNIIQPQVINPPRAIEKEVFHLPRGGTATIREPPLTIQKGSDLFVPSQVMKQVHKNQQDGPLSSADWPELSTPPKETKVEKGTLDSSRSPKDRTKPYAEISKSQSPSNGKATAPHPAGMTVLKPKTKRRIAANFQNP